MSAYDIVQTCAFHQGLDGDWDPPVAPSLQFLASVSRNSGKQRRNSGVVSLFFISPNHRQPRISAENEMSIADNLWAKQQKQREPSRGRPFCASYECV